MIQGFTKIELIKFKFQINQLPPNLNLNSHFPVQVFFSVLDAKIIFFWKLRRGKITFRLVLTFSQKLFPPFQFLKMRPEWTVCGARGGDTLPSDSGSTWGEDNIGRTQNIHHGHNIVPKISTMGQYWIYPGVTILGTKYPPPGQYWIQNIHLEDNIRPQISSKGKILDPKFPLWGQY